MKKSVLLLLLCCSLYEMSAQTYKTTSFIENKSNFVSEYYKTDIIISASTIILKN